MMTQYFDMLKEVGSTQGNSTVFLNHSPSSIGEMSGEVCDPYFMSPISCLPW